MRSRKSQIKLVVSIVLLLVSFFVIFETIGKPLESADMKTNENACLVVNQLAQQQGVETLSNAALRACKSADIVIPMDDYSQDKEGVKKNIADKIAKTWAIWLEGRKANYFGSRLGGPQKCFIQYTFEIKKIKDLEPISKDELLSYFSDMPHQIGDTSDRCAGTKGGYCREECEPEETPVKSTKQCTGKEGKCCVKNNPCESKGGKCYDSSCPAGAREYINFAWNCGSTKVCCIDNSNFLTYLTYVQSNNGAISIPDIEFYPQDHKISGKEKKSETYAIVFSSYTTNPFWWEGKDNINRIIIAPLNEVSSQCTVKLRTWS
jgi:hypothetical protein